jgi:hypothetical protein
MHVVQRERKRTRIIWRKSRILELLEIALNGPVFHKARYEDLARSAANDHHVQVDTNQTRSFYIPAQLGNVHGYFEKRLHQRNGRGS